MPNPTTKTGYRPISQAEPAHRAHTVVSETHRPGDAPSTTRAAEGEASAFATPQPAADGRSWRPLRTLLLQGAMDAGVTVAGFSSAARATWHQDPFHYRAYAAGAAAVAASCAVTAVATDSGGVSRRLMQDSAPWALLTVFTAGALQTGLDGLNQKASPSDTRQAQWNAIVGGVFLGVALVGCLGKLGAGASDAQRHFGRVPVGHGSRATAGYAAGALSMALVGCAVGFHGLFHGDEAERATGFLVAGLAAIPALCGLLTATAPEAGLPRPGVSEA